MGFLSRFEGKMEDTFEGAANRMANAPISPVQIAKKAEKQMRREKMVGAGKQYAPTLYTVLVNPNDDQRLFGYYPTLAGETETYLAAKAADEGLVMDGQPLVRFIVDEGLKHGKFDIIAEAVAAPIIAQLRAEEMQRYGIGGAQAPAAYGSAAAQRYSYGQPAAAAAVSGYRTPAPAYSEPQPYQNINGGFDELGAQGAYNDFEDNGKPPLPYVPEEEIDYSIDYGEYTFNSQDFNDYRKNRHAQGEPEFGATGAEAASFAMGVNEAGMGDAAAGVEVVGIGGGVAGTPGVAAAAVGAGAAGIGGVAAGGMNGAAPAANPYGAQSPAAAATPIAASTVVFANGAAQASPVPNQAAVRASLIDTTNNRTYSLASARLLLGREQKNDIVVNDINVSRTHAELRLEPQGVWTITDLGSTNGTFVNDIQIATQPLYEGDRITLGMTNYVFTQA